MFLPPILIPTCNSSSPAFLMMFSAYRLNKQGEGETYRRDLRTLPELYSPLHKVNTGAFLGAGSHICLRWSEPCQGFGLPTLGSLQESGLFLSLLHFSGLLKRCIKLGYNFRCALCVERCVSKRWGEEGRMYRLCHSQSIMLSCRSLPELSLLFFLPEMVGLSLPGIPDFALDWKTRDINVPFLNTESPGLPSGLGPEPLFLFYFIYLMK